MPTIPAVTYVLSTAFSAGVSSAKVAYGSSAQTFDVLAALVSGGGNSKGVGGAFAVTDADLAASLDVYPVVVRSGASSPDPQVLPIIGPVVASILSPVIGDGLQRGADGLFHNVPILSYANAGTFTAGQTITPAGSADLGLTLNAKDQQNYTETGVLAARPVIRDLNYTAAPSSSPGGAIDYHGIDLLMESASANVTSLVGLYPLESNAQYSGAGTIGRLVGGYFFANNTGAGTVAGDISALQTRGTNTGGGTVAEYRGVYVRVPDNTGSTMTLLRGVYIEDMTGAGGSVGTAHAIYSNGGQSYHKGAIGIDLVTVPSARLHVRLSDAAAVALKLQCATSQTADLLTVVNSTDSTNLLRINKDGFVGIGAVTPISQIHLKGQSAGSDIFLIENFGSASKRVVFRDDGSAGFGLDYSTQSLTGAKLEVEFNGAGIKRTLALNNSHASTAGDGTQIEWRMGGNQWGLTQCVEESGGGSTMRFSARTVGFVMTERLRLGLVGVGFNGAVPQAPPAYTQTYATASHTHANLTAAAVATTAATQTTPWGFSTQAQADAIVTNVNALLADLTNLKQVVNAVIDDQQANGLFA